MRREGYGSEKKTVQRAKQNLTLLHLLHYTEIKINASLDESITLRVAS